MWVELTVELSDMKKVFDLADLTVVEMVEQSAALKVLNLVATRVD